MTDDLPPALKRDANNVAPFMRTKPFTCVYPECDGGPATGHCRNECAYVRVRR